MLLRSSEASAPATAWGSRSTTATCTIPMGLVLGYVRSSTQRVWPGVVAHVLNNAVTLMRVM